MDTLSLPPGGDAERPLDLSALDDFDDVDEEKEDEPGDPALLVNLTLPPFPTALAPPCLAAAAVAAATMSAALILVGSPATKLPAPLGTGEVSRLFLLPVVTEVEAMVALLPPAACSCCLLGGTISSLPSGCRDPPCLVRLIFIFNPFSLS